MLYNWNYLYQRRIFLNPKEHKDHFISTSPIMLILRQFFWWSPNWCMLMFQLRRKLKCAWIVLPFIVFDGDERYVLKARVIALRLQSLKDKDEKNKIQMLRLFMTWIEDTHHWRILAINEERHSKLNEAKQKNFFELIPSSSIS